MARCTSTVIAVRLGALGLRRYAGSMPKRRPYPSDLSDARWELIEPVLSAWRFERGGMAPDFGRPPEHDLRDIMEAILYVDRTGVQWRYLPHDFPHRNTVYGYFAKWADEGVFAELNGLLRQLLRAKEGRDGEPSACVIDVQSVKTSTSVPASSQGIDAGKKIVGRKRSIATDTLGLLIAVLVTAASVHDSIAGARLLDQVAADPPYPQGLGRRRLPPAPRRARRNSRHRHGNHCSHPRDQWLHPNPETLGGQVNLWLAHAPPAPGRDYETLAPPGPKQWSTSP